MEHYLRSKSLHQKSSARLWGKRKKPMKKITPSDGTKHNYKKLIPPTCLQEMLNLS